VTPAPELAALLAVHAQMAVYEGPPVVPLAECWPARYGATFWTGRVWRFAYLVETPMGTTTVDAHASCS
jgi:hypothetical protein